jgi:hypothetical protein
MSCSDDEIIPRAKTPGGWNDQTAGAENSNVEALDHAEHDRADKGERDIGGNNAQFADESHGKPPLVYVATPTNAQGDQGFPPKKVSLAALSRPVRRPRHRQRG